MKVLLLAPPMAGAGGIQRYTMNLVRALKQLLGDESVGCLAIPDLPDGDGRGRFRARAKLNFARHALWAAMQLRADLIICAHLALGPVGWLLAMLRHRPYWIVVHGIEAWVLLPYWKHAALCHADRVIVTTAFSREQVVNRHQIESHRILNLPCSLDENLLTVEPASEVLSRSLSGAQRVVLTVARMVASEQYKGHDVILRALPSVLLRVPNLVYVVVGEGDDRSRIEALAGNLDLRRHVIFTGRVSDSELVALYNRSDVFAMPARTVLTSREAKGEGFGIVFLEAMAFGKPVIGPNEGAPAEVIQHGRHGLLVNPDDSAAIAEALVDLLTNPDKAREMGQAGCDWVRKQYSYASFREKLECILSDSVQPC